MFTLFRCVHHMRSPVSAVCYSMGEMCWSSSPSSSCLQRGGGLGLNEAGTGTHTHTVERVNMQCGGAVWSSDVVEVQCGEVMWCSVEK